MRRIHQEIHPRMYQATVMAGSSTVITMSTREDVTLRKKLGINADLFMNKHQCAEVDLVATEVNVCITIQMLGDQETTIF